MEKILIHYNEQGYKSFISRINNQVIPVIQAMVNEYKKLGIGKLQSGDIRLLFSNPDDLIIEKITEGKNLQMEGIVIKKSKIKEMIQMPNGSAVFSIAIKEAKKSLESDLLFTQSIYRIWTNTLHSYFDINENQVVVIKDSMKEKIKESFKYYATSDRQKAILEFAKDIIASYEKNGIKSITGSSGDGIIGLLKVILENPYMQGIRINNEGILNY